MIGILNAFAISSFIDCPNPLPRYAGATIKSQLHIASITWLDSATSFMGIVALKPTIRSPSRATIHCTYRPNRGQNCHSHKDFLYLSAAYKPATSVSNAAVIISVEMVIVIITYISCARIGTSALTINGRSNHDWWSDVPAISDESSRY